jgi:hypothetical protein
MPRMTNGIGTWFCKARFEAGWGWDDAVECAMFLYFPLWAHRVVHMRDVPGGSFAQDQYQAFPLRYSEELVTHVFLRRWSAGFVGLGIFIAFMLGLVTLMPPTGNAAREWAVTKPILTPIAPCLIVAGLAGLLYVRPRIARERDIRRVLGLHVLGSSDPATWVEEDMARIPKADARFGTATYAEAVPKLLAAGSWTGAMWAARLAAAREGLDLGQTLTDEVLRHPGTREALARFRRDAKCWSEAMGAKAADRLGPSPPDRTV